VCEKFLQRSAVGRAKYGTDLDRQDLAPLDWIQHAQEEHMDAILYLEKLKQVLQEKDVCGAAAAHILDAAARPEASQGKDVIISPNNLKPLQVTQGQNLRFDN
jgi:hypothetical protein